MGKIISVKKRNNKRVYRVIFDHEDYLRIKGNMKNVYLISSDACDVKAEIVSRGQNSATKYFKLPAKFNLNNHKKSLMASCYAVDLNSRMLFIYVLNKEDSVKRSEDSV